ncbi:MAG: hypothetical protein PVF33_10435 [Candidatus Latescibacterota bacterium]
MTYNLTIKKNAAGNWIVDPKDGPRTIAPGDEVEWVLDASPGATAHLQFFDDIFESSGSLNEHWACALQQTETLSLTVASKALPDPRVRRRSYGYAVMVIDGAGAQYAFGNNPPPDLDVGN